MNAIKRRISWSVFSACILILVASADDFELLRFLLPGLPYSARVTLDDKNGDFLQVESVGPLKSQVGTPGWTTCLGVGLQVAYLQWEFCHGLIAGDSGEGSPAHIPKLLPLRC